MFSRKDNIEIQSETTDELIILDINSKGKLTFTCHDDSSVEATKKQFVESIESGELRLFLDGENNIGVSEGYFLNGVVVLNNVNLFDPDITGSRLSDIKLSAREFLTAKSIDLKAIPDGYSVRSLSDEHVFEIIRI